MINENLINAIKNNNLILFIGAGASTPFNFPSWKKLVLDILDHLDQNYSDTSNLSFKNLKQQLENNNKSPLDILKKIENDEDSGELYKKKSKEYIYNIFQGLIKKNNLTSEVHKSLWELSSKIITTNYDPILEYNDSNSISRSIFSNDNDFLALQSQKQSSEFLYKIHGDYKNPETIILFQSDYNKIYDTENANKDTLSTFFKNKTFLFIGFSLTDPFINSLFEKIKSIYNGHTVGNHFIINTRNNGDFSKFDVTSIEIDNWDDGLKSYLKDLIEEKNALKNVKSSIDIETNSLSINENRDDLLLLIDAKTEELLKNPSNKELAAEIHNIRSKINKHLYEKLDYLKTFDSGYKNANLQALFDTIYANEKLEKETIDEINRIRTDFANHKWFERCQLVSAITCSLFIFNKADEKKISLLVDFINDNEDKVWDRALTYLFIILNHLGHKWLKFESVKKKIKSLTLNTQVQNACQKIVQYILFFGGNKFNFTSKVFENPHFANPYNYFLPFFQDNNPFFENIYDNYKGENIEEFIEILEKSPFPDSYKYIVCNSEFKNEEQEKENKREKSIFLAKYFSVNASYYPFAAHIQEFVSFVNNFPNLQNKKLIDTQLKITSTPLKDYLLNETEKHRALGMHFQKEKNWGQAIINFEKCVFLNPDDLIILDNLANCYFNNKDLNNAEIISNRIMIKFPSDEYNYIRLSDIYNNQKKTELGITILEKFIEIDNTKPLVHYKKSILLLNLGKNEEALTSIQKSDELFFADRKNLYNTYGEIYKNMDVLDKALDYFTKSILIDDKESVIFYNRANTYHDNGDFAMAINDIDKALAIDSSDQSYFSFKAMCLLAINELDKAYLILSNIKDKDSNYYNILANYYRLTKNYDKALEFVEKAISLENAMEYVGTKAAIYSSMGDEENFYKYLREVLSAGIKAKRFMVDIKNKYKDEKKFIETLEIYNQEL